MSDANAPATGDLWSGGVKPYQVNSKKFGMWLFIVSDSITFATLLVAYSFVRLANQWPTPFNGYSIALSTTMTFFLLSSSLTMVLAVARAQAGQRAAAAKWIFATALGGLAFVVLHSYEWHHIITGGQLKRDVDANGGAFPMVWGTFFACTGMHMLHVTIGVAYLVTVGIQYPSGKFRSIDVEVMGLYWHFVDLVWMFVFPLIYLMSARIG